MTSLKDNRLLSSVKIFSLLCFLISVFVFIIVSAQPVAADPGCTGARPNNSPNQPVPQCAYDAYNALPQDLKNKMSKSEYEQTVKDCNYSTGLFSGGDDQDIGACSNATILCLQNAMNTENCKKGKDYVHAIAQACIDADRKVKNGVCDPINNANQEEIKPKIDKLTEAVKSNCQQTDGNEAAQKAECDKLVDDARNDCKDGISNWSKIEDETKYEECLKGYVLRNTKNKADCEGRGGIWMEGDVNGNGVDTGKTQCYSQYSDLTNPKACAAAGSDKRNTGVWAQEPGKTGNDGWGCYDPSKVCKEDSGYTINDRAPCKEAPKTPADPNDTTPNTTVNKHAKEDFETCGTASVNLLSCSEKDCPGSNGPFSGMQVLGCVLRIGLQALTVLVGIGAVGGIAYSSFRYASASDNAGAVTEAKGRIRDIVIGLIVYVFLLAVVQWLVPGLVMDTGTSSSGTPAAQASP